MGTESGAGVLVWHEGSWARCTIHGDAGHPWPDPYMLSAYRHVLSVIDVGNGVLRSLYSKALFPSQPNFLTTRRGAGARRSGKARPCASTATASPSAPTPTLTSRPRRSTTRTAGRCASEQVGCVFCALCHVLGMVKQLDGNDLGQMATALFNTGAGGQQRWHGHQGLSVLRFWCCPAQLVKKFGTPATLESLQETSSCPFGSYIQAMVVLEAMHGRRCLDHSGDALPHPASRQAHSRRTTNKALVIRKGCCSQ